MKKIIVYLMLICAMILTAGCGGDVEVINLDTNAGVSPPMAYALAENIMRSPNDYVGKKVVADGAMLNPVDSETGKTYHYIEISDNTGCCFQNIEIILADGSEDYLEEGIYGRVTGTFEFYEEDGEQFFCIKVDKLEDMEYMFQ